MTANIERQTVLCEGRSRGGGQRELVGGYGLFPVRFRRWFLALRVAPHFYVNLLGSCLPYPCRKRF